MLNRLKDLEEVKDRVITEVEDLLRLPRTKENKKEIIIKLKELKSCEKEIRYNSRNIFKNIEERNLNISVTGIDRRTEKLLIRVINYL